MNPSEPQLHVVMYHYVRDLPRTQFPAIKGLMLDRFQLQVDALQREFEMATLATALDFLTGNLKSERDLCLLTFDDGLREHAEEVTPILSARGIQGLFFLITSTIAESRVAPVHMNHFLMAKLGFPEYTRRFAELAKQHSPENAPRRSDDDRARRTYPLDTPEVASFKYLFNFTMDAGTRDKIVTELFESCVSGQEAFSRELYLNWNDARRMQAAGMVLGGHTHNHRPLATLTDSQLREDLRLCREHLQRNVATQSAWPFCYPYGKSDSFDSRAIGLLKDLDFDCSFSTETGACARGAHLFSLPRMDCNRVETFLKAA